MGKTESLSHMNSHFPASRAADVLQGVGQGATRSYVSDSETGVQARALQPFAAGSCNVGICGVEGRGPGRGPSGDDILIQVLFCSAVLLQSNLISSRCHAWDAMRRTHMCTSSQCSWRPRQLAACVGLFCRNALLQCGIGESWCVGVRSVFPCDSARSRSTPSLSSGPM